MFSIEIPTGRHLTEAEEAKLMQLFYDALPTDSHLKRLLKGLPEYFTVNIKNDTLFPVVDELYKEQANYRRIRDELNQAHREALGAHESLFAKNDLIQDLQKELAEKARKQEMAEKHLIRLQEEVIRLKAMLFDYISAIGAQQVVPVCSDNYLLGGR